MAQFSSRLEYCLFLVYATHLFFRPLPIFSNSTDFFFASPQPPLSRPTFLFFVAKATYFFLLFRLIFSFYLRRVAFIFTFTQPTFFLRSLLYSHFYATYFFSYPRARAGSQPIFPPRGQGNLLFF